MNQILYKNILIILGWFFVLLGMIGIVLPVLPTTPFMIVALAFFAKSSPRFHQMLLNNRLFGGALKQWEDSKTVSRRSKYRALLLVFASFSISIMILHGKLGLQAMLVTIAIIFLIFIWHLKEEVM
ncbi:hypothetical protein PN36_00020 [Candidatus Thiomargarita nelsonii]|uniref:Inner membrane protein n=1 Tax=Candidatus Thiomargarita nelsonii TaxID=1003181 RepID=A0A4E0QSJ4_9GAMM|nr:hypothetical protein PN36_00020 [Candidatus Thiomargarita nelsonii]